MNYIFLIIIIIFFLMIVLLKRKIFCLLSTLSEYETLINEHGEKNHEYKNQLLVLKGYLNDKKKLEEYLNTLIDDHRTGDNYEIRQLSKIKQPGIKQLLYCKIQKIKKSNITFCPYISDSIKTVFNNFDVFMIKDITKLLGILLDNSIDASKNSNEKEIFLNIDKDKKYINIRIKNSIDSKKGLEKVGKKRYSTKGHGHGFGLLLAKDIIRKNEKLELVTDIDEKYFSQTLIIDTQ